MVLLSVYKSFDVTTLSLEKTLKKSWQMIAMMIGSAFLSLDLSIQILGNDAHAPVRFITTIKILKTLTVFGRWRY